MLVCVEEKKRAAKPAVCLLLRPKYKATFFFPSCSGEGPETSRTKRNETRPNIRFRRVGVKRRGRSVRVFGLVGFSRGEKTAARSGSIYSQLDDNLSVQTSIVLQAGERKKNKTGVNKTVYFLTSLVQEEEVDVVNLVDSPLKHSWRTDGERHDGGRASG